MRPIPALAALVATLVAAAAGCGPQTELGGTPIPNEPPDTEITARPPDLDETASTVSFSWIGYDPDGHVTRYEWKLSDDGDDGISVQDTLTLDPVTGATLHPWRPIAAGDSSFVVTADRDSFPGEPAGVLRSWQSHTFFVRAVDEDGARDPSPAMVSFTATTLSPSAVITTPVVPGTEPFQMAPAVAFRYGGVDPDFPTRRPTRYRWLCKPAVLPSGEMADTRYEFMSQLEPFASFADSGWSSWLPFAAEPAARRVEVGQLPARTEDGRRIYYAFCLQTRDTTGAPSVERTYGVNLMHFWISPRWPTLTVVEPNLGRFVASGLGSTFHLDLAPHQEVSFSWAASADSYAGEIVSYRYGWDLVDANDPRDLGWAVAAGNTAAHRRAPARSFTGGTHTLVVEAVDDSGQLTRVDVALSVVPLLPPGDQLPCLIVDDVFDRVSNSWPSSTGRPMDRDTYRDAFWTAALGGPGGVRDWFEGRDVLDTEELVPDYRTVAQYRAVVWTSRWVNRPYNFVSRAFRATSFTADPYNWLASYQTYVGNVLHCASRGMDNFLQQAGDGYAMPIVFASREGDEDGMQDDYRVGFGIRTLPDGTVIDVGPTRYPYATWGIAVLDQMAPASTYAIYGTEPPVKVAVGRRPACVALKGLVLDPAFASRRVPDIAPEIGVETTIDWRDLSANYRDNLSINYPWGDDEFYDEVVVARHTPWTAQACAEAPDGLCVEPMFRARARFDWIRAQHLAADPDDPWPAGYYELPLHRLCGAYALTADQASAVTEGTVVGFVSHRTVTSKPSRRGDVNWGFDPYRFDHDAMAEAVRWVLTDWFGLPSRP